MVGFAPILLLSPIPSIIRPLPILSLNSKILPSIFTTIPIRNPRNPRRRFVVFAQANNGGKNKDSKQGDNNNNGNNGGQEDLKRDQRAFFNFNWRNLLEPDPENIVAVGLTGLLTWASVQVLYQLFFISIAILVAALKLFRQQNGLNQPALLKQLPALDLHLEDMNIHIEGVGNRYRNNAEITTRHGSVSNMLDS